MHQTTWSPENTLPPPVSLTSLFINPLQMSENLPRAYLYNYNYSYLYSYSLSL